MEAKDTLPTNMASFDLSAPIDVTFTFEDIDDDDEMHFIKKERIDVTEEVGEKEILEKIIENEITYKNKRNENITESKHIEQSIFEKNITIDKNNHDIATEVNGKRVETDMDRLCTEFDRNKSNKKKIHEQITIRENIAKHKNNHSFETEINVKENEKVKDRFFKEFDQTQQEENKSLKENKTSKKRKKADSTSEGNDSKKNKVDNPLNPHINEQTNLVCSDNGVPRPACDENNSGIGQNIENISNCSRNEVPSASSLESYTSLGQNYVLKSLHLLSEHLIFILQHYNKPIATDIEKYQKNCLLLKEHFFNLSYSITFVLLIPNENNIRFMEHFCARTMFLASTAFSNTITIEQLKTLISEMINWTKKKNALINKNSQFQNLDKSNTSNTGTNNTQNQHPLLAQYLKKPADLLDDQNKNNNINVYSHQPYPDAILKNAPYQSQEKTVYSKSTPSHPVPIPNNLPIQTQRKTTSSQPLPSYDVISKKLPNQSQDTYSYQFGAPGRQISIEVDPSNFNQRIVINPQSTGYTNARNCSTNSNRSKLNPVYATNKYVAHNSNYGQQQNVPLNVTEARRLYQPQQVNNHYQNSYVPSSNVNPGGPVHRISHQAPWQKQTQAILDQNYMNYQHNVANNQQAQQAINNQPIEEMRSLSTDSGFISPPPYGVANNDNGLDGDNMKIVPLITHVTSLNPSVSYSNEVPCHVCRKSTKLKCLDCMQFYYCSYECQQADWHIHKNICSKYVQPS